VTHSVDDAIYQFGPVVKRAKFHVRRQPAPGIREGLVECAGHGAGCVGHAHLARQLAVTARLAAGNLAQGLPDAQLKRRPAQIHLQGGQLLGWVRLVIDHAESRIHERGERRIALERRQRKLLAQAGLGPPEQAECPMPLTLPMGCCLQGLVGQPILAAGRLSGGLGVGTRDLKQIEVQAGFQAAFSGFRRVFMPPKSRQKAGCRQDCLPRCGEPQLHARHCVAALRSSGKR